jgi:Tfp pilus assembly protein PilO
MANVDKVRTSHQSDSDVNNPISKDTRKDMGKVALLVSLLVVVLIVIFYFSLKQNIAVVQKNMNDNEGVKASVEALTEDISGVEAEMASLQGQVSDMDALMTEMQSTLAELEELPQKAEDMVYASLLNQLAQQAEYLGHHFQGQNKDKVLQAQKLLKEVQEGSPE